MALFSLGYKKKLDEVKRQMDEQEYELAALTADEIPMKRLKSASELNLIGKAYKCNGDFLQAKEAFERSYEIRCSRTVLLDLMDCCLEIKDLESAEKFFDEYHKVAAEDKVTQYKYRYRIEKKKGRERRLLITILEELKALEYMEEYAYELAKQYHKAGMQQECMQECNDIILWFGFGPTVERAKALLAYYKGEISLDDIKSAGERYQTESEHHRKKENTVTVQPEREEPEQLLTEPLREAEPAYQTGLTQKTEETEALREAEPAYQTGPAQKTEESEAEPAYQTELTQETEAVREAEPAYQTEVVQETVPEEFAEAELAEKLAEELLNISQRETVEEPVFEKNGTIQENSRIEEELYTPATEPLEISNERLAELIKKKKVSIPETLKNFGRIERIQKQVIKSLELAINDREKTYLVISGEPQTGKTTFALSMIRLFYQLDIVKYDRTATIDAVQLNQVSLKDYDAELKNCNLIIENAGGMTKESIDGLLLFSKENKGKTCVVLEDSIRDINKFLRAREEWNSLFNNRIHLGKYSVEDLFGFAYDYIEKEEYDIDKGAANALHEKIEEIVKVYGNEQRLLRTLKLVEVVMARAEKRTSELLLSMASEGKIQQGNYLVILLEDVTA